MLIKQAPTTASTTPSQRDHAARRLRQAARLLRLLAAGAPGGAGRLGRARCTGPGQRRASWRPCLGQNRRWPGGDVMEKSPPTRTPHLQQLLRVRHRQGRPGAQRPHPEDPPWTVEVEGLVKKPRSFDIDDLLKLAPMEERIYRLRCVEGWSMVIPWVGYSLSALIKKVEPTGSAKFVEFVTLADPRPCRLSARGAGLALCRGPAHGRGHAPADAAGLRHVRRGAAQPERRAGAPGRALEVRLQERQEHREDPLHRQAAQDRLEQGRAASTASIPTSTRGRPPALEPGHRARIGEDGLFAKKRKTLMFNGYEAQVGQLYAGMDLKKFY
jgi:sulfoxide reductase catalytic subunit YedY